MNPEVFGVYGAHGVYGDFTALAALALEGVSPLRPPQQQSNGDCWLLAAAFGLQMLFPHIFKKMIHLKKTYAVVVFPRAGAVAVNYVFSLTMTARTTEPMDVYWAVLEKALCLVLFFRKAPAARPALPNYGLLNGGRVQDALELLSPVPFATRISLGPRAADLAAMARSGLIFLEVPRGRAQHALLVLGSSDGCFVAYDPWGMTALVPMKAAPVLWYYPLFHTSLERRHPVLPPIQGKNVESALRISV